MTRAVGDDDSLLKSLQEVVGLFRDAQTSVFKLMSSVSTLHLTLAELDIDMMQDSVPKFLKEPKYATVLAQHNFDHAVAQANQHGSQQMVLPERSKSKAVRDRDRDFRTS
jgi:protoheme ferro-lyase